MQKFIDFFSPAAPIFLHKHINLAWLTIVVFWSLTGSLVTANAQSEDWRNIRSGTSIPDKTYSDQPYLLKTNDNAWLCVMTTGEGHEGAAGQHIISQRSFDQGKTWDKPQYMRYSDGRLMKNPRAANFAWKCENGKFLYWFHNHGGRFIRAHPNPGAIGYNDRNPVWIAGGVEVDGAGGRIIKWSQPEILLYDDDPMIRMSYPDLMEEDGNYFITETQKDIARVHQIDNAFLERLWGQLESPKPAIDGLTLDWTGLGKSLPQKLPAPVAPTFCVRDTNSADYKGKSTNAGFTIGLGFLLNEIEEGQVLADTRDSSGKGWWISAADKNNLDFQMNDGQTHTIWSSDPGSIQLNTQHQVSILIDGGPNIIAFVIDGHLNDGGEDRQFGWGRFSPFFQSATGSPTLLVGESLKGKVSYIRYFNRALMVTEALANQNFQE